MENFGCGCGCTLMIALVILIIANPFLGLLALIMVCLAGAMMNNKNGK